MGKERPRWKFGGATTQNNTKYLWWYSAPCKPNLPPNIDVWQRTIPPENVCIIKADDFWSRRQYHVLSGSMEEFWYGWHVWLEQYQEWRAHKWG